MLKLNFLTLALLSLSLHAQEVVKEVALDNSPNESALLSPAEKKEVIKEAMIERRDEKLRSRNEFSLGFGTIIKSNTRKNNTKSHHANDLIITPIPFINFKYHRLELGAGGLSFTYLNQGPITSKVFLNRMGDSYENPLLKKRLASLSFGAEVKYEKHSIQISRDIQKRSKSSQFEYSYNEFKFLGPKYFLIYGGGIEVLSKKYMQYYYGVSDSESSTTFKAYDPGPAINFRINSIFVSKLTQNISLTSGLGIKYLSSEIQKSPTSNGDSLEFFGLLGLSYKF